MAIPKSKMYRDIIDELVDMCHNDQGQISARRAWDGVWNQNAMADYLSDQHEMNGLLSRMSAAALAQNSLADSQFSPCNRLANRIKQWSGGVCSARTSAALRFLYQNELIPE